MGTFDQKNIKHKIRSCLGGFYVFLILYKKKLYFCLRSTKQVESDEASLHSDIFTTEFKLNQGGFIFWHWCGGNSSVLQLWKEFIKICLFWMLKMFLCNFVSWL